KKKAELADLTSETDLFLKYMAISVIVFVIVGILILLALIAFKSLCMVIANMGAINLLLGTVLILCGLLLITLIIGVTVYMSIAFSQSLFILYEEKDLPATKVLSKSFDMMDGYTLEYLILTLTFIGWFVLCVVTLGIGYIFLAPYLLVVYANFYKVVKKDYKTAKGDKKPEKIFNDEDTKAEEE
ncbi:MAG: DUF975 family protein, partial [Bacilli bacterium]|nr:DUF975 family protein [Bacilli bacterium]